MIDTELKNVRRDVEQVAQAIAGSRNRVVVAAERYKSICDNLPIAIIEADSRQNITYCNESASELFGYEHGELLEEKLSVIIPPEYLNAHNRGFDEFARTRDSFQLGVGRPFEGMRRSGRRVPINITLAVTWVEEDGQDTFYVAALIQRVHKSVKDVTE